MPIPDYIFFLEELNAANYRWQRDFPSMLAAAKAYNLEGMYWLWLAQTQEGHARRSALTAVADAAGAEQAAKEALERFTAESNLDSNEDTDE